MLSVQLCRFSGVVRCVMHVTMGGVRMMGRRLVITCFVMLCRFAMMARRVLMMLGPPCDDALPLVWTYTAPLFHSGMLLGD